MTVSRSIAFAFSLMVLAAASPAQADKRVALVLGNSNYQNAPRLPNPVADAAAIAQLLKSAGFDTVEARRDLGNIELKRAIREFANSARDADVALVYFAGHGIEVRGTNYLIPTDAKLATDIDTEDEAISLERIINVIEPARKLRLVILDACRDNPFGKTMQRTIAMRAVLRGLAKIEPASPNTMVAYAAKAGSTAEDGAGTHSPFTTALLTHIASPGLDIRKALGRVRDEVLKATGGRQEPFVYGSLGGDDVALVPEKTFGTAAARNSDPGADLRGNYELAAAVGTREAWQAFLNSYGQSGFYADLARAQLGKIVAAERAQAVADEASRRAENIDKSKGSAAADRARADAIEKAKVAAAAEKEKLDEAERAKQQAAQITGSQAQQLAAISPGKTQEPTAQRPPIEELPRLVQAELRRVGCYTGSVTSDWNTNARASLERFNKHSGQRLETRTASLDAFDVIRSKSGRVCPLTCQHGYRAQGETCVAIVCRTGYIVGDDNECEPARAAKSKAAARSKPQGDIPPAEAAVGAKSDAGVTCNARGCRTVPAGCKRETFFGDGRITEAHERIVCP